MSAIAWISVLLITVPMALLFFTVVAADTGTRKVVKQNLLFGPQPLKAKKTKAPNQRLGELASRITPRSYAAWLNRLLNKAGRPAEMPLQRLLVLKPLLVLAIFLLGFIFFSPDPGKLGLLLLIGATTLAYFTPDVLLDSRAQARQEAITLELPNTLDQMLIAVEAGLGFESAMAKAASTGTGPLAMELRRTIQDLQMGRNRSEAYWALIERTDVKDLKSFVRAITQADKYGISIGRVLRTQADVLRLKRRQRAEEKAMKVPVKILFPLIFTILPVLFIVMLSPAIVSIGKIFNGGGL